MRVLTVSSSMAVLLTVSVASAEQSEQLPECPYGDVVVVGRISHVTPPHKLFDPFGGNLTVR